MTNTGSYVELPLIPLRDMVVFPHTMSPFVVGRASSMEALQAALSADKQIFLVMQNDPAIRDPQPKNICRIGTVANIVQAFQIANGNYKLLVEGQHRGRWEDLVMVGKHYMARCRVVDLRVEPGPETELLQKRVLDLFEEYVKHSQNLPLETMVSSLKDVELGRFSDTLISHIQIPAVEKQALLEVVEPLERIHRLQEVLEGEMGKMRVDKKIHHRVRKQMEKAQREYYLNEKMKAIQRELGRGERGNEIDEYRKKIDEAKLGKDAREKAFEELDRLEVMPPVSAEATVSRNYLEWLLAVPWHKKSREIKDVDKAETILNEDHYGLEKVKERILEYLAVRQLVKPAQLKGSILCFVGPPGVGKTSLGRSIARATGRQFVRLSLGGVRDEAEIRGHRRTYIGAYPGRIIQMMRKAGTVNPVFLLDEVDKIGADFRGDPSSALLEVLDPEQNDTFLDHYLDTEYDLHQVMFLTTANVLHTIPQALRDRMEVIRIAGYTQQEKIEIAKRHLIAKQLKGHGLSAKKIGFTDDALRTLIERYTSEAGVRNLEREIASICRKIARKYVVDKKTERKVDADAVPEYLGVPRHRVEQGLRHPEIGAANGLAWTEMGGQIMQIEASIVEGSGKLILTGNLGQVMQESAKAGLTYVRSRAKRLGITGDFHQTSDIHVHVPEGAIPKDGPSAGITITTALVSALTRVPVRDDIAMTGEVTLRGHVLPVGGIKEKLLAAFQAGLRDAILPEENRKDLEEMPEDVKEVFTFHFVKDMDEVLKVALTEKVLVDDEGSDEARPPTEREEDQPPESVTH